MLSPEAPVSCIFCPNEGGAFKQTNTNRWAHLLCAIWIPEVGISNPVYMEPIDQISKVPRSRWKLVGCCAAKLVVFDGSLNRFRSIHPTDMLPLPHPARRVHPVFPFKLLLGVPRDLCEKGGSVYGEARRGRGGDDGAVL